MNTEKMIDEYDLL
jgi:hypothetical protein